MQLLFTATPRRQTFGAALAISAIGLVLSASATWAQSSGGPYTLRKVVIASGAQASGTPFAAVLTASQPVAGTSSGGPYRLKAGFHPLRSGATGGGDRVFCDGFESNVCP